MTLSEFGLISRTDLEAAGTAGELRIWKQIILVLAGKVPVRRRQLWRNWRRRESCPQPGESLNASHDAIATLYE
jgi:hypothetical protein